MPSNRVWKNNKLCVKFLVKNVEKYIDYAENKINN